MMLAATGLVTGVGLDSDSTCAALRCGISAFAESGFFIKKSALMGARIPFTDGITGRDKILRMASMALEECIAKAGQVRSDVPVVLCLSEVTRPGRFKHLDDSFLLELRAAAGLSPVTGVHQPIVAGGRVGVATALARASVLLSDGHPACIVAAVDTYLNAQTLASLGNDDRLLTEENVDGFIPGEAAGAVLLRPSNPGSRGLEIAGIGFGREPAPLGSQSPSKAEGMTAAIKAALADGRLTYEQIHYRVSDVSGEQHRFRELSLALGRTLRVRKPQFDLWHPADCIGETGAAVGIVMLAMLNAAGQKQYAPGAGSMALLSNDTEERAAIICRYRE